MLLAVAAEPRWLAPSMTTMLLPSTRVSYGTSLSRFSTRRVRSFVSAATIESSPEVCTSMRREGSASVVLGRSKEMRAGLSMVNDSGCGAGPDRRIVSCSCWPGQRLHVDRFELRAVGGVRRARRRRPRTQLPAPASEANKAARIGFVGR